MREGPSKPSRPGSERDLDASNEGLVNSMLDSAMQPAHASLWLSPDTPPKGIAGEPGELHGSHDLRSTRLRWQAPR